MPPSREVQYPLRKVYMLYRILAHISYPPLPITSSPILLPAGKNKKYLAYTTQSYVLSSPETFLWNTLIAPFAASYHHRLLRCRRQRHHPCSQGDCWCSTFWNCSISSREVAVTPNLCRHSATTTSSQWTCASQCFSMHFLRLFFNDLRLLFAGFRSSTSTLAWTTHQSRSSPSSGLSLGISTARDLTTAWRLMSWSPQKESRDGEKGEEKEKPEKRNSRKSAPRHALQSRRTACRNSHITRTTTLHLIFYQFWCRLHARKYNTWKLVLPKTQTFCVEVEQHCP